MDIKTCAAPWKLTNSGRELTVRNLIHFQGLDDEIHEIPHICPIRHIDHGADEWPKCFEYQLQ